jgi:hypothetical protein
MKALLVVNADDFGLTEGTNQAIIDAHRSGIVTRASLLANGDAFEHAVSLAQQHPSLGVGVHLTLTEGSPVSPSADGAVLLGPDGKLPLNNLPFVHAATAGRLPHDAIRREFEAQVHKIIAAGITPTHLDGHKYIHLLPGIISIVTDIARQSAIPMMRVPHRLVDNPSRLGRLPGLLCIVMLGKLAYPVVRRAGLCTADRVAGFVDTGHLSRAAIRSLLRVPRPGLTELLCHPAYRSAPLEALRIRGYKWIGQYEFETETAAVSESMLRAELKGLGWTLVEYGGPSTVRR